METLDNKFKRLCEEQAKYLPTATNTGDEKKWWEYSEKIDAVMYEMDLINIEAKQLKRIKL